MRMSSNQSAAVDLKQSLKRRSLPIEASGGGGGGQSSPQTGGEAAGLLGVKRPRQNDGKFPVTACSKQPHRPHLLGIAEYLHQEAKSNKREVFIQEFASLQR